ncbi:hypothetical protein BJ138DRAFT_1117380 [Hygrophoropsis aurantiaca]|uniref:Uncharacterized protein n=1 Tax=Hygrophoropsis aurantiaca TaxID=72124 RepID=A0ACB7ZZY0_9AGAM|nr:hypothetical protein BJ138DRAFT_1117380 [Hygrophoropsis aurantiaca]
MDSWDSELVARRLPGRQPRLLELAGSVPASNLPQSSPPTSPQSTTRPLANPVPTPTLALSQTLIAPPLTTSSTIQAAPPALSPTSTANQPKRSDISKIIIGCAVTGILIVALLLFLMWRRRRTRGKITLFRYQDLPNPPSTSSGTRGKYRTSMAHLLAGSQRASASSSFIQYPDVNDDQESSSRMSFVGDIGSTLASLEHGRDTEKVYSPSIRHPEPTYTDSREVSRDPWFSQIVVQDKEQSIMSEFLPPYPRSNKSVS